MSRCRSRLDLFGTANKHMYKTTVGKQSTTNHWAHDFMMEEWNGHNTSRAMEMFQSGEGVDFVIEVQQQQEQQPSAEGPSKKGGHINRSIFHEALIGSGIVKEPAAKSISQHKQTDQKEFNVHKFILIANSEVFSAMLRHKNTAEFREGRITIKDSNAIVVRHMINYMYTGQISDDFYLETDALPLFAIAHKYQIKPLMDFTEQLLIESLTLDNVFERLKFAELYQAEHLKCSSALMIWQNLRDLKRGPEWTELKQNSPELIFYIIEECS